MKQQRLNPPAPPPPALATVPRRAVGPTRAVREVMFARAPLAWQEIRDAVAELGVGQRDCDRVLTRAYRAGRIHEAGGRWDVARDTRGRPKW